MKKLLAILLALCMVFTMMPITASAESAVVASGTCGDNLTWVLDEEGMLTISGEGAMNDYTMPQYVPWYSHRSKIIRAWVQEGVTSLGNYAFYSCSNMFDITLPESLERIGTVALGCTALDYVYIPSGVTEIGGEIFSGSEALTYISVSDENTAYSNDDKGVLFNKDHTTLIRCPYAFADAYVIPSTVETVAEKAFDHCQSLTEVTVPGSVKELRRHAFAACDNLAAIHLNEGLEFIADEVFMNCFALTGTMVIPSTVKRIGSAFFNCPEVTAWKFLSDMPEFEDYTFGGISVTVYYPAGNPTWTAEKIEAVKGLSTFEPYDTNEEVASGTWGDNITWKLTVNGTLIISGEGDVQEGWTSQYPWYTYASQIRKVIFEEGVTNVPEMVFLYEYPNLVSAELKSVEVIGNSAFCQCGALTSVTLPDTLKRIETSAFVYTALENVQIPAGVTYIGSGAFSETSIQEIVLPEGLLELGDSVFWGCKKLKSAYLPDSITTIGKMVFGYCTALETANIPANLTSMPEAMFNGCSSLKSIEIPDGIEYMYMGDFRGSGLVSVTIPASVKIMGSPFADCLDLEEITFLGDAPEILEYCFENVTATAYYPAGNETWTEEVMQNYGGTITWVGYNAGLPCADGHHVPGLEFIDKETGFCAYCDAICHSNGTTIWAIESDGDMIIYGTGENGAGQLDYYDYLWTKHRDKIVTLTVEDGVTGDIFNFEQCTNLKTVYLSDDITVINKFAFALCSNLEQVNIPSGLTYLGSGAFQECKKLKEVYLPATITVIGSGVFANCNSLEILQVDENNPYYYVDDRGVLYGAYPGNGISLLAAPGNLSGHYTVSGDAEFIWSGVFWGCADLTSVTISEGVQMLDMYVFKDCTSLKSVTFPNGLMEPGFYTFENCTALETVIFEGNAPDWFDSEYFLGITATVYYPAGNDTWTEDLFQDYGGTITWVPYGDEAYTVEWKSATTSLNGAIDLNIYVVLSENLMDEEDAFVRFSYGNKVVDVPIAEGVESVSNGVLRYRYSCPMYAKEVSEIVTVQVMKGDEAIGSALEYSIVTYCMNRINKSTNPAQVALCKALLNYAAAAQISLNYNTENLANAQLAEADKILPDGIDVSGYAASNVGSETGIKTKSATLMLESEVSVRVYFTLEAGYDISDFTFTIDGKVVEPQKNNTGWFIETDGIAAKNLDQMMEFSVGGITVTYGPMSYVNSKLTNSKTNADTLNLVKALYAYWQAAEALLG